MVLEYCSTCAIKYKGSHSDTLIGRNKYIDLGWMWRIIGIMLHLGVVVCLRLLYECDGGDELG